MPTLLALLLPHRWRHLRTSRLAVASDRDIDPRYENGVAIDHLCGSRLRPTAELVHSPSRRQMH
jgi:hypothetical protein